MATVTYNTNINSTDDANFRIWSKELSDNLITAGLVRQLDTGQIDFTTAVLSSGAPSGYEIFSLNDFMLPIFIKFEYGIFSGIGGNSPQIWVQVGEGSDGAGNLTGTVSNRNTICFPQTISDSTSSFLTRICVTDGYLGLAFKMNAISPTQKGHGFLMICRSTDANGDLTTDSVFIYRQQSFASQYPAVQVIDRVRAIAYPESADGSTAVMPQSVNSTAVVIASVSRVQAILHNLYTPEFKAPFGVVTALVTELAEGDTTVIAPIGSKTHTYISLGNAQHSSCFATNPTENCLLMVWE